MVTVAKGDAIMQVTPPSLRFWEKLGLSPKSGPKDVTAFVFFEGADEERETEIEGWLSRVSAAYSVSCCTELITAVLIPSQAKGFGVHEAGISSHCTKQGLAPTRFETLRKTLSK